MGVMMKKYKKASMMLLLLVLCFTLTACMGRRSEEGALSLDGSSETSEAGTASLNGSSETGEAGNTVAEKITISENSPVRIAVIDTGFSTRAIAAEHIAEGKNYLDALVSTEDTYGHGTAVASVILQYAPEVQLVPLVSSAYEDGHIRQVDADTLAQILRDAVDIYGCQVINISAGLKEDNETLKSAVEYVQKRGALLVASAGNDYVENGTVNYYPAAYDSVLAVGALNADETEIADFSQRGNWVDIYAPGQNISVKTLSGASKTGDGTSYAAARVSGEAAVLWKNHPDMTEQQIRENLTQTWSME